MPNRAPVGTGPCPTVRPADAAGAGYPAQVGGVRTATAAGAAGAALGAVVAVVAHFTARTVPHIYYVAVAGPADGRGQMTAHLTTPLVHPGWWPTLPVAVGVGLVAGLACWRVLRAAGLRLVRAASPQAAPR